MSLTKKIMLIDDQDYNLDTSSQILTPHYDVETYLCSIKAKCAIFSNPSIWGLIITDYQMPILDGVTLSKFLLSDKRTKNIPIVIYSAYDFEKEDLIRFNNLGISAVFEKMKMNNCDFLSKVNQLYIN